MGSETIKEKKLNFNDFENKTKNKSGVFVTVLSLKGKK
jgi:hypothetical protein